MAGTNTGDGGFEIDGKVYSFDVGELDAPGIEPTNEDNGDLKVDKTVKDISKKTKVTLGTYLSQATKGGHGYALGTPNAFTVDPPSDPDKPNELNTNDEKGMPVSPTPTTNSSRYVEAGPRAPQGIGGVVFDSPDLRASETASPDPAASLTTLGKGKQGKQVDGHSLLLNVSKDQTPEPIETYRSTVLTTNRFTSAARMSENNSYRIGDRTYNSGHLKQVGVMLSLRASQEFPAAFSENVNPVAAASVIGAMLPSPAQLGVLKVPNLLLEAQDALKNLSISPYETAKEPTVVEISPLNGQSWGALNNVEEPWSGTLNLGMVATALALQVALLLAFEGLGAMIGLIGNGGGPPAAARNPNGSYTKGSYYAVPTADPNNVGFPPNIMALLGIHGTRFPFGDALRVGTAAFFVGGDRAKEGVGSQIGGALSSAVTGALADNSSAGHLIIVSRLIIRTGQAIAAQVEKIANAFVSNPISGTKGIMGLIDIIKQSKLIAAINIFTVLGDAILSEDTFSKDTAGPTEKGMHSTIDSIPPDAAGASVKKSRLKKANDPVGNSLKLAWASNRAPTSYLIPESVATMALADAKLGGFRGPFGAQDPDSKSQLMVQTEADRVLAGARIPRASTTTGGLDVKKIESMLDSEYMPFYFHDLRTNEIIGFHAFLASLSDDFTASWETTDAYGRVDPIKVYKSTVRRIGMSFYVVATDEKDFDEMWIKINKLVTLLYPQYTKGRTLTDGTNTSFVQPFSQLIGSSPLIRIRLGDLIRSNYSRFALARLFGAADGDMKLSGQAIKFEGAQGIVSDPSSAKQVTDIINAAQADLSNTYHLTSAGWASAMEPLGSGMAAGAAGPSSPDQAPTMKIDEGDLPYFEFKIKKPLGNGMVAVEPTVISATDLVDRYGFETYGATLQYNILTDRYNNKDNLSTKVVGGTIGYAVPQHALRLTPKSLNKVFAGKPGIANAVQNIDQLSAFLDIEKNALVKSFRAIQGKGLAGVIETMSFDWYDKVQWDIRPEHRAPKTCKVTLTFAPIHDISPGIDHLGYNRSPVYPVGGAMGQGFDPDKST